MTAAVETGRWTVDEFATGMAGRRCHLVPCPLPYSGPYGTRVVAEREAEAHFERCHGEVVGDDADIGC